MFLKRSLILSLGFALFFAAQAQAYTMVLASNADVAETWNRAAASEAGAPVISTGTDGSAKVEWKNNVTAEVYNRLVNSPGGATTSAYRSGTYYRADYQTDLRRTETNNDTDFLQFSLTATDDTSVLSRRSTQINNIQFGRSTEAYYISGGDQAVNFSSLGSALAVRGVQGQAALSDFLLTAYGGVVADSWDSVTNSVPRSTFLRNAFGAKLERNLTETLTVYVTGQNGQDQSDSITDPAIVSGTVTPRKISNYSLGFDYKSTDKAWSLTGETATSNADIDTLPSQSGNASLLDGSWKGASVGLQAGYHILSEQFTSLSTRALAGVEETYGGADWQTFSWLKIAGTLRKSVNTVLAAGVTAAQKTETYSNGVSTLLTLSPAWGLTLQKNNSKTQDLIAVNDSTNEQSQATVRYNVTGWVASASYGKDMIRSQTTPGTDSDSFKTRLSLGHTLSDATDSTEATWLVDLRGEVASQNQKFLQTGNSVVNNSRTISAEAQFLDIGSVTLSAGDAVTTRPNGLADLKSNTQSAEFSKDFLDKSKMRLYVRNTVSNDGDDTLRTTEQAYGAQYSFLF